ncbi:hypothetical protein RHMOL_Rhmol10G0232900 [Rhododendron molle]|uniref:Uncharacterized protein n=1 Tax=Rhododendron molle TaxID=49168 RepID=A0ACC0M6D9_RHOML|nr:hypothetical protein RHMOL_Rhmol10G0232900 [Rhododendron molle]
MMLCIGLGLWWRAASRWWQGNNRRDELRKGLGLEMEMGMVQELYGYAAMEMKLACMVDDACYYRMGCILLIKWNGLYFLVDWVTNLMWNVNYASIDVFKAYNKYAFEAGVSVRIHSSKTDKNHEYQSHVKLRFFYLLDDWHDAPNSVKHKMEWKHVDSLSV